MSNELQREKGGGSREGGKSGVSPEAQSSHRKRAEKIPNREERGNSDTGLVHTGRDGLQEAMGGKEASDIRCSQRTICQW